MSVSGTILTGFGTMILVAVLYGTFVCPYLFFKYGLETKETMYAGSVYRTVADDEPYPGSRKIGQSVTFLWVAVAGVAAFLGVAYVLGWIVIFIGGFT